MKFAKILAAMAAMMAGVAFFASCDGDEGNIEGSWELTKISEEVFINGKSVESHITKYPYNGERQWVVFDGGTMTSVYQEIEDGESYVMSHAMSYRVDGNKLIIREDDETNTYKYKISGKKATLTCEIVADEEELANMADHYDIEGTVTSGKAIIKVECVKVNDSDVPKPSKIPIDLSDLGK